MQLFTLIALAVLAVVVSSQNARRTPSMKELKTQIDPVRTFDIPEEAPRARIISIDFLKKSNRKIKTTFKDDARTDDFRRWRLDELTDREMRSSKEVKNSVKSPFGSSSRSSHPTLKPSSTSSSSSEEEKNIGEFFPTRLRL